MEYNLFFVLKIGCMASSEYLLSTSYTCTLPVTKNGDQLRLLVFPPIANKVNVTISYAGRVIAFRLQPGALIFTESAFYARRIVLLHLADFAPV